MRLIVPLVVVAAPCLADEAEIVAAELRASGASWTVDVTLRHGDTGWDDYADGWRVETEAGDVLGTRTLFHPHVEEQPFTRSLSDVTIPDGTDTVYIRARTNVTGWGETRFRIALD